MIATEHFGSSNLINEVIWLYKTGGMPEKLGWGRKHDNILFYTKNTEKARWNPQKEKSYLMHKYGFSNIEIFTDENGQYTLVNCRDVFDIPALRGNQPERVDFSTQEPEALLERIILASSNPSDLVADFFCGSGTTLAVAEKLGRRWIGCDLGRWAIHVTRKRLLSIPNCKPFEVLNLGKYERQYWQGVTFGNAKDMAGVEQRLYEYLVFILKLYSAQPVAGLTHLHGKKGKAMVHIGAVDAPVTLAEIDAAVEKCAKLKQSELHVLGWEWEMGIAAVPSQASARCWSG